MNAARRKSLKRHAIRRARERYDVGLEFEDIESLSQIIRLGLCRTIENKSRRRGQKVLIKSLCGTMMAAVYDPKIGTIATFLPWQATEVQRALVKMARDNAASP
jgi:hypothetical protein